MITLVVSISLLFLSPNAFSAPVSEAKELLKKVQKQLVAKDDQATVKMTIAEAKGEKKVRTFLLQTLRDKNLLVLAKVTSPVDLKNTALVAEMDAKGRENQWNYSPASKQLKKVPSGKEAGILGSEFTAEDLNVTLIKSADVSLIRKDAKFAVVQLVPAMGASAYNRILITVSLKDFTPTKIEYYVEKAVKKTVKLSDFEKVGGKIMRAKKIEIKNSANKRGTVLEFSGMKVNTGLKVSAFSEKSLRKN